MFGIPREKWGNFYDKLMFYTTEKSSSTLAFIDQSVHACVRVKEELEKGIKMNLQLGTQGKSLVVVMFLIYEYRSI